MSLCSLFFFFKPKTAYEMRISDWSSDVCSSDLADCGLGAFDGVHQRAATIGGDVVADTLHVGLKLGDATQPVEHAAPELLPFGEALAVPDEQSAARSEGRRVGKEGVSTGRSRV